MATEIVITLRTIKTGRKDVHEAMKPIFEAIQESDVHIREISAKKVSGVGDVLEIR